MNDSQANPLRILVADDDQSILFLFEEVFSAQDNGLEITSSPLFDIVCCLQGGEAVEAVKGAVEENKPFAVAFVDIRMPPGPDGIWTAEKIRAFDPNVEIVFMTAYSDVHPADISSRVPPEYKLLYIQKPFYPQEIYQFASSLGSKWQTEGELRKVHQGLETRVEERTIELENKTKKLEELNTALKVLLSKREEDKSELEERMLFKVKELVVPVLEKLKKSRLSEQQESCVDIIELTLNDIISPFIPGMPLKYLKLTATEIQIANLIKQGKTTKEIAEMLTVSTRTVEAHRKNIRKKFGIKNTKTNLRTHLLFG